MFITHMRIHFLNRPQFFVIFSGIYNSYKLYTKLYFVLVLYINRSTLLQRNESMLRILTVKIYNKAV